MCRQFAVGEGSVRAALGLQDGVHIRRLQCELRSGARSVRAVCWRAQALRLAAFAPTIS
jgi:hypothetical protein